MTAIKVDQDIEQEITSELEWELGLGADEIGVKVHAGLVTLTGTAGSYASKMAAQEAALRVLGVTDVANEIHVRVSQANIRNDGEIARAVRGALEWDVFVPDERIISTVSDGLVTLRGSVESLRERNEAESAVRRLVGVRGLHNEIDVLPATIEAEDLQRKIEVALARRAIREADRIGVTVNDGRVTLSGEVQSWDEKRALLGLVSHAPGVRVVEDHLTLKSRLEDLLALKARDYR